MAGSSMPLTVAQRFWRDIERINTLVAAELASPNANVWEIHLTMRERLSNQHHDMITRIVDYTVALLDLPSMRGSGRIGNERLPAALKFYAGSLLMLRKERMRWLKWKEYRSRSDELLMENLNAAWLGLYFLGVPFIHPWEKVRRLADYRGGFPSGGCTAKYIGDVYRLARHRLSQPDLPSTPTLFRFRKPRSTPHPAPILVLTHTPLVMLRGALTYKDESYATPDAGHELGRHYALLQMLLYIRCGYPVHFFVPLDALAQSLDMLAATSGPSFNSSQRREKIRDDIRPWLRETIFPGPKKPGQAVHLLTLPNDGSGMPTCILGPETGIYTLESGDNGLHFAGNELREALLASYRDKLQRLLDLSVEVPRMLPMDPPPRVFDLLSLPPARLGPMLANQLPTGLARQAGQSFATT